MKMRTISKNEIGRKITWTAALWVASALMTTASVRADIYSWQDAEGVIHYSNQNVPPQASIYMKEPVPSPKDAVNHEPQPNIQVEREIEAVHRQVRTEVKLEEANRRLDQALEKVEELTNKVTDSQAQAAAAAEAAQQAAIVAESKAQAAGYNKRVDERVVVYSSPYYPHRYKKQSSGYRGPHYRGHLKKQYPNSHLKRYEKLKQKLHSDRYKFNRNNGNKFKRNRHYRKNGDTLSIVPMAPIKPINSHRFKADGRRSRIK